jgi:hypothetical protein
MTAHTPTPWTFDKCATRYKQAGESGVARISAASAKGYAIGVPLGTIRAEDAAHIVACVNAHDDLVARVAELEAALGGLLKLHDHANGTAASLGYQIMHYWHTAARENARKAIEAARAALAKGNPQGQ